jgi:large subunit ribosomal protein L23
MPILSNIFKKNGQKQVRAGSRKGAVSAAAPKQQPKGETAREQEKKNAKVAATPLLKQERAHGAYQVLVRPHISEKSVAQTDKGRYVFEIRPGTSARRVARAVEETYGVEVKKVNVVKVPAKKIRFRSRFSLRPRHDKAVIILKEGHQIEVLPQ